MTILKLHIHRHNMSRGPPTQKTSLIENSIFKVSINKIRNVAWVDHVTYCGGECVVWEWSF